MYAPEGRCYLKAKAAVNRSFVPNAGFISGRCAAPEPRCDEVDVNVRSHELSFRSEAVRKGFHLRQWATPCSSGDYGGAVLDVNLLSNHFISKCGVPRPGVDTNVTL